MRTISGRKYVHGTSGPPNLCQNKEFLSDQRSRTILRIGQWQRKGGMNRKLKIPISRPLGNKRSRRKNFGLSTRVESRRRVRALIRSSEGSTFSGAQSSTMSTLTAVNKDDSGNDMSINQIDGCRHRSLPTSFVSRYCNAIRRSIREPTGQARGVHVAHRIRRLHSMLAK